MGTNLRGAPTLIALFLSIWDANLQWKLGDSRQFKTRASLCNKTRSHEISIPSPLLAQNFSLVGPS